MDPDSLGIVIGLSFLASVVFVAIFTNIFIISANLCEFYRNKKLHPKDEIQVALKVSSIMFTIMVPYNEFSNFLHPDFYKMSYASPLFTVVIVYCMCSCTSLFSLQCFFNFIKIVHFQCRFIQWMKVRISSIVSWQIVVVEMLSLCISLLHLIPYKMAHFSSTNSSYISSPNMIAEQMIVKDYMSCLLLTEICVQHIFSMTALFITIGFLRYHMKKMKDTNTSGEVHQYNRAVQTILRLLLFYTVFYVMVFLYYFAVFALYSVGYWINVILVSLFIPIVNVLQILRTPHLRTTWKEMTRCFLPC